MKNLMFMSLTFGFAVMVGSGCQKQEDLSASKNSPASTNTPSSAKTSAWGICCVWNGVDACVSPKVNCFDEIVVTPSMTAAIADLDQSCTNGPVAVSNFFTNGAWAGIWPDLDADEGVNAANIEYLEKLRSGNYALRKQSSNAHDYYLAFRGTNTKPEFVLALVN